MYIGFIFDQIWHIKRLSIYIRNVLYSTENPLACPIRYVGILGRFTNYNTPDSVNFHDLSISVKYLTQDRMNVKICSKYVWYDKRWWFMLRIFPLFYSKWLSLYYYIQHYVIVILCIWQGDVYFIHISLDIVHVDKTLNMHWKWSVFSSCSRVKIWL